MNAPSLAILYGPSGSGKTRMLKYVEELLSNQPDCLVLRCCTSGLVDRLVDSLKHGVYEQFLSSLMIYQVLLIDNIWILSGKVHTAKGIFSIFERLIHRGRAVVIASDLKPSIISDWSEDISDMIRQSRVFKIDSIKV